MKGAPMRGVRFAALFVGAGSACLALRYFFRDLIGTSFVVSLILLVAFTVIFLATAYYLRKSRFWSDLERRVNKD